MPSTKTDGFYQIDNSLIDDYGPKIGVYGVAVYNVLAKYGDGNGDSIFPSYQTIANQLGISRRKVISTIEHLSEVGLIDKAQRRRKSGYNSNVYRLSKVVHDMHQVVHDMHQGSAHGAPNQYPIEQYPLRESVREAGASSQPEPETPPLPTPTSEKVIRSKNPVRIKSPYLKQADFVDGYIAAGAGINAVQVYYERFEINHDKARLRAPQEDDLVRLCQDLDKLREVITAYSRKTYQPGNISLILDWYRTGIPVHSQNGHGPSVTQTATVELSWKELTQ